MRGQVRWVGAVGAVSGQVGVCLRSSSGLPGGWPGPGPAEARSADPGCGSMAAPVSVRPGDMGLVAVPRSRRAPIGPPAGRWESKGWSTSYLAVVRRAHVGLLPSRSGRIAMYAAAVHRPSPASRSPEGIRRSRAEGVVARGLGGCLGTWPRGSLSSSGRLLIAVACGDRCVEGNRERYEVLVSCGVAAGVPGLWHCPRLARRSAGRLGGRRIGTRDGVKFRLDTAADGLTAHQTRVPDAERPSPCR